MKKRGSRGWTAGSAVISKARLLSPPQSVPPIPGPSPPAPGQWAMRASFSTEKVEMVIWVSIGKDSGGARKEMVCWTWPGASTPTVALEMPPP